MDGLEAAHTQTTYYYWLQKSTILEIMQRTSNIVQRWNIIVELLVNPEKAELKLFTKKTKLVNFVKRSFFVRS